MTLLFEKMKKYETKISVNNSSDFLRLGKRNWNGDQNALKVRKGEVNSYISELNPKTVKIIETLTGTNELINLLKRY